MGLTVLAGQEVQSRIEQELPGTTVEASDFAVVVKAESVLDIMRFLKESAEFDFNYLTNLTSVDYNEYFEVVYHLVSMKKKHTLVVKTRCGKENPEVQSVTSLWLGADYQEREVYDLMGISFSGHPRLRRILLWDGFEGHPLRKDYSYPAPEPPGQQ
ncbi:MAG: NADH-quinone oxidoreductase subunit C [Dehalococcoidia bacterium]